MCEPSPSRERFENSLRDASLKPTSIPSFDRRAVKSMEVIRCYGHLVTDETQRRPAIDFDVKNITTSEQLEHTFEAMDPATRKLKVNMCHRSGETILMKLMRRATGNHLAPILRLLLGWGADYMVCCDSGKTFVRDLLWRDWQAEDEGGCILLTLQTLSELIPACDLLRLFQFPCALGFTAFDYLDHSKFHSVRDAVVKLLVDSVLEQYRKQPDSMQSLLEPILSVPPESSSLNPTAATTVDSDSSYGSCIHDPQLTQSQEANNVISQMARTKQTARKYYDKSPGPRKHPTLVKKGNLGLKYKKTPLEQQHNRRVWV